MEVKKCKFCGAPIVWLKTQNGRPMPCNAAAVKYQENYKGKDVIVLSDGKVIKATVVNPNGGGLAPIIDGEGYISHFATCTHADEARQPTHTESPAPPPPDTAISDVLNYPRVVKQVHTCEKPIPLLQRLISTFSHEGDIIFDGFAGGGTTAIAARKLRRKYICFELDKNYFDIATSRIENEFAQASFLYD